LIADQANRFVFSPHIAELGGLNAIFQFGLDVQTGPLTPNTPDRVTPDSHRGPRHLCFHPSQQWAYGSDEQGASVSQYADNPTARTLAFKQRVSTLPEGFAGENTCSQIQVTADGRFLYAPNRGHQSVACFAVDATDGTLSARGHPETERVPRAFSIDASGKYVLVAGLETSKLAIYRIDPTLGTLEHLHAVPVGRGPMWVLTTS
jgi:6-phosphogluconolactonase